MRYRAHLLGREMIPYPSHHVIKSVMREKDSQATLLVSLHVPYLKVLYLTPYSSSSSSYRQWKS